MSKLKQIFKNSGVWRSFLDGNTKFCIENETTMTLFMDAVFSEIKKDILIVTSTLNEAQLLYSNLQGFFHTNDVLLFPNEEVIRLKKISQSKEISGERIYTLGVLANSRQPKIVITNFQGALSFTTTPSKMKNATMSIKVNDQIDISILKRTLQLNGYQRVDKISASLQYSSRGDVVDVFPINSSHPIRIDFFDDRVEEIKEFRISNQKSFKNLDEITIFPASEHQITSEEKDKAFEILMSLYQKDELNQENLKIISYLEEILNKTHPGVYPPELKRFTHLFELENNTIIDYLNEPCVFMYNHQGITRNEEEHKNKLNDFNNELVKTFESIPNLVSNTTLDSLFKYKPFECDFLNGLEPQFGLINIRNPLIKKESDFSYLRSFMEQEYDIIIGAPNNDSVESIKKSLERHDIYTNKKNRANPMLIIEVLPFYRSFVIENERLVYLTESDIFMMKKPVPRFISHYKEGSSLESYLDLELGDYIVHEKYGIAKYRGLQRINSLGSETDCLELEYANDNILFVPVLQIDQIRKYLGRDGYHPTLTRLNTKDWERMKKRVRDQINDSYDKLLELYKKRLRNEGISFKPYPELEIELDKSFPHILTDDQQKSLQEIYKDMEDEYPMDRLLCGDVGFGKTEVALRATHRALVNDYQVCLVCPTTILAGQHYELFKSRLEPLGFNVKLLSRFVSKKDQNDIVKKTHEGKVDVLIATHRAMSNDVSFDRLGLLVIDEEQRFGVKQKETIKQKYPHVDVLSLSATPIPRTLQMSLLSLRSISRIDTPPPYRNPIQTYVVREDESLVAEIIEQELGRNGQVFYLLNRINLIDDKVFEILHDVPHAKVGYIHAKMTPLSIEEELLRFYKQDINVLICTTIIENGIDFPNANTLIVENSQNFGLAQLYQIKGRVGRSDRIAYAYLMYDDRHITDQGIERLKAIQQHTDLGSGYKIAEQDLLIRGAGEIIGENQSGFISNVGLDMYTKLFEEVMYERTNNQTKQVDRKANLSFFNSAIMEIDTSDDTKMELYQRLSRTSTFEEINEFKASLLDEFGKLPDGIEQLIEKRELDLYSNFHPITDISEILDEVIVSVQPRLVPQLQIRLNFLLSKIRFSKFAVGEIRIKKHGEDYLKNVIMIIQEIVKATKRIEGD